MSTSELLKARFSYVRRELDEVLDHVNDKLLPWAPLEGMRTVRGQILEIGGTEMQTLARLMGEPDISWEEAQDQMGREDDLASLRSKLLEVRTETLDYIDSIGESGLAACTAKFKGWFESLGLSEIPVAEVLRSVAQHEYYHTGQLTSYLWSRGDDPYKWA